MHPVLSIIVTTHNRAKELRETLQRMKQLTQGQPVEYIVYNDASTDETKQILNNFKDVRIINGIKNIGLIAARNILMQEARGEYILSIDDDSHVITPDFFNLIQAHFDNYSDCGVIAARIFWGKSIPPMSKIVQNHSRVKSFVGCGHVWRKSAWQAIPHYPEWFQFYGEEDFASYHLYKINSEIHFLDNLIVHHRVNLSKRKKNKDYLKRSRRSLRAGWYLMFLFYPYKEILKRFSYSLWIQLKIKVFKGDLKYLGVIILALLDLIFNFKMIMRNSERFSNNEFLEFLSISDTRIYS